MVEHDPGNEAIQRSFDGELYGIAPKDRCGAQDTRTSDQTPPPPLKGGVVSIPANPKGSIARH